ncbi:MAG: hypothetical protein KatS3mg110_1066 [Pirellulaceae bacterium]|nr:MAG: hypothetical protein KatS3mg110_1066 [Pirellulaceae bacterium]
MDGDRTRLEAELTEAFVSGSAELRRWLQQAFERLYDQADDILHDAFTETLRRIRSEGFCSSAGWITYLRVVARNRAIDRLRSCERRIFRQLASHSTSGDSSGSSAANLGVMAIDSEPGPSTRVAEDERRSRQGILLSQVLEEFCRWCESKSSRLLMKEAYERSLRGQKPFEIAAAMGIAPSDVYSLLHRARNWIFDRIRQADVERSVFLTLYGHGPT